MDTRQRHRSLVYITARQKKKLIEFMAKHPELISCKVTQEFNHKDKQDLWVIIANECNAIPGPKKTWRQWRKTWQDIKSKTKKRRITNDEMLESVTIRTTAEQELNRALGLKNVSSTTHYQDSTEFVPLKVDNDAQDSFDNEIGSNASLSEPESDSLNTKSSKNLLNTKHSNNCFFNCDMLAVQEQRKLQVKEDYYSFKKDYLRQKLEIMKEHTEALKSIAKELASKEINL